MMLKLPKVHMVMGQLSESIILTPTDIVPVRIQDADLLAINQVEELLNLLIHRCLIVVLFRH